MIKLKISLLALFYLVVARNAFSQDVLTNGNNYYLICMDDKNATTISSNIVADFRPDNITNHLYIWANTYLLGLAEGPNSFGSENAYNRVSLIVNNEVGQGLDFILQT